MLQKTILILLIILLNIFQVFAGGGPRLGEARESLLEFSGGDKVVEKIDPIIESLTPVQLNTLSNKIYSSRDMYAENIFFTVILDYIRLKAIYQLDPTLYDYDKEILGVELRDNISVHYTGYLEDGTQFDSSYDRGETLTFTVGAGQMIKGFDQGVIGMRIREIKKIIISAEEAYGEYDDNKIDFILRSDLQSFVDAGYTLEVGEELPTQYGNFTIIESNRQGITVDMNHALAGKILTFDIELIEIHD